MRSSTLFLSILFLGCFLMLSPHSLLAQGALVKDSLQINQLKVMLNGRGNLGWIDTNNSGGVSDWGEGIFYPSSDTNDNYVLFSGTYWIGGYTPSDSLRLSWERFQREDFHPGPTADNYDANYDSSYQKLWKVSRQTLVVHDQNWWKSNYTTPQVIQEWPAHGDTSNGEAWHLAPFKDLNDNGTYEPQQGDRPIIRGDKAIYFIANDLRAADSSDTPLGVEVHGMIYAFDCPKDSALKNSFMIHYEFINRSNTNYDSLMIGHFSDFDIGCATDDHVGSDVERGIAFGYNGDGFDQTCNGAGYDSLLPAAGQVFLKGPELEPNGTDDAWNGPGEGSVNGIGFDDGIVDNEHWGMQHAYYYNIGSGPTGDPRTDQEFYNYMTGTWKDTIPVTYGGDGYDPIVSPTDTLARFMFPWDTDPQHYSTYGIPAPFWSDGSAGNAPGDRRIMSSTGPTVLAPGDTAELDMAYVVAQDPDSAGSNTAPVYAMKERVDSLRSYFLADQAPCSDGSFSSIPEEKPSFSAKVYPNPSQGRYNVQLEGRNRGYRYELYSLRGELIERGRWNGSGTRELRIEEEGNGLYFLRIRSEGSSKVVKLMKR